MTRKFDKEQRIADNQTVQDDSCTLKSIYSLKQYFIYGKTPFISQEQQNFFKTSTYFLALLSPIMHIILVQQQIYVQCFSDIIQDYLTSIRTNTAVNAVLLLFSISIKILMGFSVIFEQVFKIKFVGISWIFTTFVQSNMSISEFDLALSSFMALINWTQYFPLLIVAIILNLFQAIYLQDYVIRKNPFYTNNAYQYILFRCAVILIYLCNNLFLYYKDKEKFYIFYVCFGIVYSVWYFKKGCRLFAQNLTKNIFMSFNMILMTIFVSLDLKIINDAPFLTSNQIFKFILILLILVIIMYIRSQNLIYQIRDGSTKNQKQVDILLKQHLEKTQNILQAHSQLIGILKMQKQFEQKLYDPFLKQYVSEDSINIQKKTALGYFIKQGYEKSIEKYNDVDIYINYCQFLCNEFNHIYLALKLIQKISSFPLNIIQKLKVSRLKLFIQDQNTKTNQQLYNKQLKIQLVVESQTIFEKTSNLILKYTDLSYNIWKSIRKGSIISSQVKKQFKMNFLLIEQIQKNWNKISVMFIYNPRWQITCMYYLIFIKNQSNNNRSSILQKDNASNLPTKIDQMQEIFIDEHQSDQSKLLDQAIIFNCDSSFLIAKEQRGKLIIQRVNKRFIDATGYKQQQIDGSQIQILMPVQLAQIHQQKFDYWLNQGKMSNQNAYLIQRTSYVTKQNQCIPAIKYYKAYYQLQQGIQFVCLLKRNTKNQRIIQNNDSQFLNPDQQAFDKIPLFKQRNVGFSNIQRNIFIKCEQLKPKQTIEQILKFKFYSRLFIFLIITSMIALSRINQTGNQEISNYCNQFLSILYLYRSPIVLSTNYMKKVTKLGNMANVNAQIQLNTKMMLSLSASPVTKSVIFNQDLNPNSIYYPSTRISQFHSGDLENIDLFYTIVSAVSSLNQPIVNHTSRQFQILHSYAKPAYDTMMNITKYRLHQTIQQDINKSITKQLGFLLLQIIIFLVLLIKILTVICKYFKKINTIELIVTDFNQKNSSKIEDYWKTVDQGFKELFHSFNHQKYLQKEIVQKKQKQLFLRNHSRTISFYQKQNGKQQDKSSKRLLIKIFIIVIFGLLTIICLLILPQIKMLFQFYQVREFEAAGFLFLRYFPCGPLLIRGCMQKYFYQCFPSQTKFDSQKYDDALLAVYRFGNSDYVANTIDQSSLFYSKQKEYFFGKPCQYNPALLSSLNISVQKCNTICNHSFQSGLLGYFRYLFKIGKQYLKEDKTLPSTKIDELTVCTTIVTTYYFDAISTWTSQITIKIKNIQQNNTLIMIVVIIITVIHVCMNQLKLVSDLSKLYDFIKYLYNNIVPEFIITEEKILRQKLMIQGLIEN